MLVYCGAHDGVDYDLEEGKCLELTERKFVVAGQRVDESAMCSLAYASTEHSSVVGIIEQRSIQRSSQCILSIGAWQSEYRT
jgi:hypothetical protein